MLKNTEYVNGRIYCRIERSPTATLPESEEIERNEEYYRPPVFYGDIPVLSQDLSSSISIPNTAKIDLNTHRFYLMLVTGDYANNNSIDYHENAEVLELKLGSSSNEWLPPPPAPAPSYPAPTTPYFPPSWIKPDEKPFKCLEQNKTESIYDNCNRTKACHGVPYGCLNYQSCKSIITIEKEKSEFVK